MVQPTDISHAPSRGRVPRRRWEPAAALVLLVALPAYAEPQRAQEVLQDVSGASTSTATFSHEFLFLQEPSQPLVWPPPGPVDPSRDALDALRAAPTNEFSAPPLIVTRIATLPAASGATAQAVAERFERVQLRDAVSSADRMYREGHPTNAIELLQQLVPSMKSRRNQVLLLNRIAAYFYRQQQYVTATEYMHRAYDADPSDAATACNLAAGLLSQGHHDEALKILKTIPAEALGKPQLAFSIYFNLACAYSLLHEPEPAIENLAKAVQVDPASTSASLGDPQLDGIRSDTRFTAIRTSLEAYISRSEKAQRGR